tara:strand:+ start:1186 stop:1893 length:708 start_codon:yes stop_codon:yes gene_type:complete
VLSSEDKIIINDLFTVYPEEGCGLLVNKRGKLVWDFCKNVADNKKETFQIPAENYIKASLTGSIHAIVHSHPDISCEPSDADKKASDHLGIPYIIYSLPQAEKFTYTPQKLTNPLLGRTYEFGKNDCWSLVRDYYRQELDIELPMLEFEYDWWENGLDYFGDLYESFGFVKVEEPQRHDGIMFQVMGGVPNHCGVYLGEGIFMHHAEDRLSCTESLYSPIWRKNVVGYYRCKQFI